MPQEKNISTTLRENLEKKLVEQHEFLKQQYREFKAKDLKLNIMRGIPSPEQLEFSNELISMPLESLTAKDINDVRNYGGLTGTFESRELFKELMGAESADEVMVLGNSSLNIMYDTIVRAMMFGVQPDCPPWGKLEKVKFLCPVPGYDRHFSICEAMGIEMINIEMSDAGPDMDEVEKLVSCDESIKGIWCVPKYSNPDGITYSDETVLRLASISPAARDFRIFWDNAYLVHDLEEEGDELLNIFEVLKKSGREDMVYMFTSMSKVTFAGASIAAICASRRNVDFMKEKISVQTIGPDKINQQKHAQFFKNKAGVMAHMEKHKRLLKPKFDIVTETLEKDLGDFREAGIARWTKPRGGYFISIYTPSGCAKRTHDLCAELGVEFTVAGATYPYRKDINDSNIRVAPTFPSLQDLTTAVDVLCLCVKLAYAEKIMQV